MPPLLTDSTISLKDLNLALLDFSICNNKPSIQSTRSAVEIWNALNQIYSASSMAQVTELRTKLQTLKKDGLSTSEYIQRLKSICNSLAAIGEPVSEKDHLIYLFNGLDQFSYPAMAHPAVTHNTVPDTNWYMDLGATHHFTPDINMLDNVAPFSGSDWVIIGIGSGFEESSPSRPMGPSPVRSISGARYFLLFIDDHTRFTWFYLLKTKDEVYPTFLKFQALIEKQVNTKIKAVQSDWAGEFRSLSILFSNMGIVHCLSCLYTSQQNGRVERKNRHVVEMGMPLSYWPHAFQTATYLINRLPIPVLHHQSPYFTLYHKLLAYTHLKGARHVIFNEDSFPFKNLKSSLSQPISSFSSLSIPLSIPLPPLSPSPPMSPSIPPPFPPSPRVNLPVPCVNTDFLLLLVLSLSLLPFVKLLKILHGSKPWNWNLFPSTQQDLASGSFTFLRQGLEVHHTPTGIHLSQAKYITDLLTRAAMLDAKPCPTPMSSNTNLSLHDGVALENDANWASCPNDRRSTSGYCLFLGSNLVSWSSSKKKWSPAPAPNQSTEG
ncbi:Retrovirus-related Pol polyprotein from transposon RE2 [Vitis vinifera]|uniref:Retrovirus-related Pol polyprotein from transposon RE2 n=1 Tax=Vitis vinifera TaxID=29760 RepID=A0A438DL84_VITVI|nr:Retrovirus-related Pol polyprotein from transposon RE2 [Vitis vinifera]